VRIYLSGGGVVEHTVHGQRGSMHDPLCRADIEAKFAMFADGRLAPEIPSLVRSLAESDRPVSDLTAALRANISDTAAAYVSCSDRKQNMESPS